MSELWDKDKLKNKEKIAELNSKIGEFDKKLAEKDELINKAKQETDDANENMRF
jgi:hypothetical protein